MDIPSSRRNTPNSLLLDYPVVPLILRVTILRKTILGTTLAD
jgi:hypothetical protein